MTDKFATATQEDIAALHDHLADLHEQLARTAALDIIHESHAGLGERLRDEAKQWRDMRPDTFASKMGRLVSA